MYEAKENALVLGAETSVTSGDGKEVFLTCRVNQHGRWEDRDNQ